MLITYILGPYRRTAVTFSDSSTRNMGDHLQQRHGITKLDPEGSSGPGPGTTEIQRAFGNALPRIVFNKEIFRLLLLRWIIINNISFRQVNDNAFRTLLTYLCACVSNSIFLIQ